MNKRLCRICLWVTCLSLSLVQQVFSQGPDPAPPSFMYQPGWWQTAICLPNDPFKTVVGREGELLYDYVGKFYKGATHGFGTTVGVHFNSMGKWVSQGLDNPAVPVVKTRYRSAGLEVTQEAFAQVAPEAFVSAQDMIDRARMDGGTFDKNWTTDKQLPGWAHTAAVNDQSAIHYQFAVPYEESPPMIKVVLAFVEKAATKAGERVMNIEVEGAKEGTFDPFSVKGKGQPAFYTVEAKDINRDGRVYIRINPDKSSATKEVFLNAFWAFPKNAAVTDKDLLAGHFAKKPITFEPCSQAPQGGMISRNDIILVHVKNTTAQQQSVAPEIIVKSSRDVAIRKAGELSLNEDIVTSTLGMKEVRQVVPEKWIIRLEAIQLRPGETRSFAVTNHGGTRISERRLSIGEVLRARGQVDEFWLRKSGIPFGKLEVPDPAMQALLQSSVRNIWQAREIKHGVPVFQVGPTRYRGLWVVDGAFLLEAATMLGAGTDARNAIMYTLNLQKPNGAFQVMRPEFYKENGIVLWTVVQHALLTQDKAWLKDNWSSIEKAFAYILEVRDRASSNPADPWYGINPPGEIDGGLSGGQTNFQYGEYSNAYWNLAGMKAAILAARWIGKELQVKEWQKQYDGFYQQVRKTMQRDMRKDSAGNPYLPTFMQDATGATPQRGQWAFCHAVYPGQVFDKEDPLVKGNLAMLENTEQEGMVVGTGWLPEGIWNYFASFYGHAQLWQGDGEKAANSYYAMAHHAAPTLVWREEQNTSDNAYEYIGDMPHNWASAEFIRMTVHLLALDRGNELHLLQGLPKEWTKPGMVTRLNSIATPFGKLTMELKIADDGRKAILTTEPLADPSCRKIIVYQEAFSAAAKGKTMELDPKKQNRVEIPIN